MTQTNSAKDIAKGAGVLIGGPLYFIGGIMMAVGVGCGSLGLVPPTFAVIMGKPDGVGSYIQKTAKIGLSMWAMGLTGMVLMGVGAAGAGVAVKKDS